jgi:hypothetical protein
VGVQLAYRQPLLLARARLLDTGGPGGAAAGTEAAMKISEAQRREIAKLTEAQRQGYLNLRRSSVTHKVALAYAKRKG